MTLDEILVEIKKSNNIVIMAHESPDGDAIGSALAMCLVLRNMGKDAIVLMKEFPDIFSYLPGLEYIKKETKIKQYDLAISVDCPNKERLDKEYIEIYEEAKVKVQFDHHNKNSMFGDYNVVNHVSPATAQILVSSFEYLQIEITKQIAICLLTGIITDTGGFKNSNVTVESFEFASWCLEKGINLPKIYKQSLLTMSRTKFEAEKLAMDRLEFWADGKITFTYLNKADSEAIGIKAGEHGGIVEIGKNIDGVEVSIFLYEKDIGYKASLRSNEYVNVSDVASVFGGGGHIKAAGATLKMSFEEAKKAIISEVMKNLK